MDAQSLLTTTTATIVPSGRNQLSTTVGHDRSTEERLKTVLHVINGEHFSGAERVQQLLGQGLSAEGFDAHFACLKDGKFKTHAAIANDHVHWTPMRSRFDRAVIQKLSSVASTIKTDLLHAHTPRSALITSTVARKLALPWVYHVHSPTVRDSTRKLLNLINGWIERRSLRRCDALITVSQSLRDEMLRRGVSADKIFVAANGVRIQDPISVKPRLHLSNWKLGAVALFRPRKGLEILLEAFDRLCEASSSSTTYSLEIIGGFETPAYERSILGLIDRMQFKDRVNLHGFVTDAPERMRELDLLVLPSTFGEGMPMVVLEAMASGIPVVATRVEGTPEVIRDSVEGWHAEPNDVNSLTDNLLNATSSRGIWSQVSANAFKRQREKFSDTTMCASVAEVYRTVL